MRPSHNTERRRSRVSPQQRLQRALHIVWFTLAACVSAPRSTQAQAAWSSRLQLDNDFYNYWKYYTKRPDEQYTNGVLATLESLEAPWWGKRFAPKISNCGGLATVEGECRATALTVGQDIYTPNKSRLPFATAEWQRERPYFAWLFVGGAARLVSPTRQRVFKMSLGVTGHPAGGRFAQKLAHTLGNSEVVSGWETQIGFEPGVQFEYRQSALAFQRGGDRRLGINVQPTAGLTAGNVRTAAELGGIARVGWNLSHPWDPRVMRKRAMVEWWLAAGAKGNLVARDMSLDGTLRGRTRFVERERAVSQYEVGGGVRVNQLVLEYRAVTRSREYRTGPAGHSHSSMIVGFSRLR